MNKRKLTLGLLAAAAITFGPGVSQAHAQDFAQISSISFQFLNDGTSGTMTGNDNTGVGKATFQFRVANAYGAANTPITADLSFVASAAGAAQTDQGFVDQALNVNTFRITARTPQGGKSNLLTITGATGDIFGQLKDVTATTSGDTGVSNTLHFTSDFINFATPDKGSFNLPLSSVNPSLTVDSRDGYLATFSAAGGTGDFATFGATTPAPEPSGLEASFAMLLVGGGLFAARRICLVRTSPAH